MIRPRLVILLLLAAALAVLLIVEGLPPDFGGTDGGPPDAEDSAAPAGGTAERATPAETPTTTATPETATRPDPPVIVGVSPPFKEQRVAEAEAERLQQALSEPLGGEALGVHDVTIEDPESVIVCVRAPCQPVTRYVVGTRPLDMGRAEALCAAIRKTHPFCHIADALIVTREPPEDYTGWPMSAQSIPDSPVTPSE